MCIPINDLGETRIPPSEILKLAILTPPFKPNLCALTVWMHKAKKIDKKSFLNFHDDEFKVGH